MVEVSAAKRNITPPFPMYMRGYAMRTGKSIGVLDELYCRTLVLRIDGEIFIWSTLDLCRLEEPISDYARTVLAGKYSVPKENIIIGTIHTHSGPDISFEDEGEDRNHRKAVYRELVMKQLFDAVDECFDRGFLEVTPYMVKGTIEGVYGNRNYIDKPSDKDINMILFPTMKPLDSDKKVSKEVSAPTEAAQAAPEVPEKIDFSNVQFEPLFQDQVDFDTFSKSDFRAVKVKECEAVKKSKKLLKFVLDDGTGTDRVILSGIHEYYEPEELVGKTCIAITNLPPRAMMGIDSCGMLISAVHHENGEEKLHLLMVDPHIPAGAKLY